MDKISHEVSSNLSSKCNSRALYKLNSLVYFMHHSEDSSRNILGNGSMTEYIYIHPLRWWLWRMSSGSPQILFLDTHTSHIHIYKCTDWVDEHVKSSLKISVVFKKSSFQEQCVVSTAI